MLWLMSPSIIQLTTANALGVTSGGTGLSAVPTNGQLLIGNGTGYALHTLGYGAGISVTNGSGTITVANTGVLSNIAGTGISVSSATGNVTVSNTGVLSFSGGSTGLTPSTATNGAVTLAGTLAIASGGTNGSASPTAGAVAYGTGTAYSFTLAGTTNQALLSTGAGTPTWNTLTSGSSILYGNGSGLFSNVTIGSGVSFTGGVLSATGTGGTVTSVTGTAPVVSSGGTTPAISMAAATTSVSGYLTSTDWNTFNGKQPAGTYVTSVSVVSANGFAGTVTTGATPAITLTTTITGLLKGNGTAISAAVANTDYVPLSTVLTKTADYTITGTDTWIINNKTGSALTLTFPAASSWTGRSITVKNLQAQLVNSASSNIVPIDSATAGTAILLNVIGNWATMVSDGTNWVIMQAASNNNLLLE